MYRESALLLVESGLNMSAFAAASGVRVPEKRFSEEFFDYMQMVFKIEENLLASYGRVIESLKKRRG